MATTKKTPVRRNKTAKSAAVTPKAEIKTEIKTDAQKKVDELLEGVSISKPEDMETDKLVDATKEKEGEWVSNQMTALTSKIDELEAANVKLQNENQILTQKGATPAQKGGISMSNDKLKKGIEIIFFELDDVFTGAKFGAPFHEAKLKPLLNKIVDTFPFLVDSLRKRRNYITKLKGKKEHTVARTQY